MEEQDEIAANEQQDVAAGDKKGTPIFKRPQQTQKQSMMDKVRRDLGELAGYVGQLESGVNNMQRANDQRIGAISAAIRRLYDEIYKDAPIVKEVNLNENNYHEYAKIIGYYYEYKDGVVIKLQPIEHGWKVVSKADSTEMYEHQGNQYPTEDVVFNYEGILESANDELSITLNCVKGINPLLKLREHLFSLNDKKTDIIV